MIPTGTTRYWTSKQTDGGSEVVERNDVVFHSHEPLAVTVLTTEGIGARGGRWRWTRRHQQQ